MLLVKHKLDGKTLLFLEQIESEFNDFINNELMELNQNRSRSLYEEVYFYKDQHVITQLRDLIKDKIYIYSK